jgi:hypothetical protein
VVRGSRFVVQDTSEERAMADRKDEPEADPKGDASRGGWFILAIAAILIASLGGMVAIFLAARADPPELITKDGGADPRPDASSAPSTRP